MSSIFQSEYFIAIVFTSFLGITALATYLLGFRKPEPENIEEESAPKRTRSKLKEQKNKKKPEPQPTQIKAPVQPLEPSKVQKKAPESPKKQAEVKPTKKQVKKDTKKDLVEETVLVKAEEAVDSSEWTTVVDKRTQKKQKPAAQAIDNESVVTEKPKIEDLNSNQLVIGSKQPTELLTDSVIQRTETKDKEDDWVTANHKSKKDKKKDKKESPTLPEVVPQIVPDVPEVKSVVKPKTKKTKPSQNLASVIQEAIVDTIEVKNPKQTLKQTSLTDSIILIEKENKRTESNQSSNESLQDVDGDDGFITITTKKNKRTVRREQ